jgi:hypothetical protein
MGNKFWLALGYVTAAFGFALVGYLCWQGLPWSSAIELVIAGLLFFWWSFQAPGYRGRWARWQVYLAVAAWNIAVYIVIVRVGAANLHGKASVPAFMTLAAPYVFGIVPLLIIWVPRIVIDKVQK